MYKLFKQKDKIKKHADCKSIMYKLVKQKYKIKKHAKSKIYICPKCISQLIRLKPMSSCFDTW